MKVSLEHDILAHPMAMDDMKAKIYPYRYQEKIRNSWLKKRLETILPAIMKRAGIDFWVVACNEYNEDPVLPTLVPMAMMTARRLTILAFHLKDDGSVRRMAITRPGVGLDGYYEAMWTNPKGYNWSLAKALMPDGTTNASDEIVQPETQWECLNRLIAKADPKKVGINVSKVYAFADGLSHNLYEELYNNLSKENRAKLTSASEVCVGWLETRSEEEMAAYDGIMQIAHAMIDEAFSSRVIIPGVTTNYDVKYYMVQKTIDLGLSPWFDYEVSIRRKGIGEITAEEVIMPGDLLHCDVGFKYLGLCTDTQENAYVLKSGETDAPAYLKDALAKVNRLQDITVSYFKEGRTGNEVLALARKKAIEEGIDPCIYAHPIGTHGHGAGPTIGLWDMQDGVAGRGDHPIYNNTAYSLELSAGICLKEWNIRISLGAETDILFKDDQVYYLAGRQTNYHLIK